MVSNPNRVLVTIHRISLGGADRVAILVANALADAGMSTWLAILRDEGEGEDALLQLLDPRVEIRRAGPALRSRHLELVRGYFFLRREVAHWRPNVVLASSNNMGLVTGLAARRGQGLRHRVALKFTNPVVRPRDWGAPRIAYRERLYRFVLGLYDRVITLSDAERDTLCDLYSELCDRIVTLPNPYVTDEMLEIMTAARNDRSPRIVACGRMMPQKRFDRLLDAFARLNVPDVQLVLLGDGPLRGELQTRVNELELAGRVHMPGFVENVSPWLAGANLLALSSDYEGFPAVVLEALACGVPVVTTNCFDGARALLADAPPCAVVERHDVDAFAEAMAAALRTQSDREVLRRLALPYRTDTALRSHVATIAELAGRQVHLQ